MNYHSEISDFVGEEEPVVEVENGWKSRSTSAKTKFEFASGTSQKGKGGWILIVS